jgi:hypothetical protein
VGFDVTGQLLIRFSAFVRYWRKKWEYNETVHQLFIDFKKAYDSVSKGVLYNILIEFGVPMKLDRLTKMCLNETYSKVRIGKHLSDKGGWDAIKHTHIQLRLMVYFLTYFSDSFPIQTGLKQGDALSPLFSTLL